jgi:pimeloyl-ACP methyl ester carboxylesterase
MSASDVERVAPGVAVAEDSTRIAYQRIGGGPPVVVLPGAMNPGAAWLAVAAQLADRYTVLLVDRRNYPPSGPGPSPSSFEIETAHVLAMARVAGEPVHLLGHSYGGVLALYTAAAHPDAVRTLLLYEPPVLAGGPHVAEVLQRYRELLAAGEPAEAVGLFLRDVAHVPDDVLGAMAAGPDDGPAPHEVTVLAEALLPDIESIAGLSPDAARWSSIRHPVLLMAGALSWAEVRASTEALRQALPHAETVTWPGHTHFANMIAPGLVAGTLREFLARHG